MALKEQIKDITNEFDYNLLKNVLKDYKHPRVKVNQLLHDKVIVRVKKGIYVRSEGPYSLSVLANMIYGPSYISQDYALSQYGLIPERVTAVTSMTTGRHKKFETPLGLFTYEHLRDDLYIHGIQRIEIENHRAYLIATPEKALVDRLWKVKGLKTESDVEQYMEYDMRFDFAAHKVIRKNKMKELKKIYDHPVVTLLESVVSKRMQHE